MEPIRIHGFPGSTYVRTARIVCLEKNLPHELVPLAFGQPSHRDLHPYLRMPALEHGSFRLGAR